MRRTTILWLPLGWLSAASVPSGSVLAGDTAPVNQRPPGWECRWCPEVSEASGELTVGAAYESDSSAKFGEYRGMGDEGGYALADVEASYRGDDSTYAEVSGRDLGLTRRKVRVEAGEQGGYRVYLDYSQLPRLGPDTGRTPYLGVGGDVLTLPEDWVSADSTAGMTALGSSLRPLELKQKRKRAEAGGSFRGFSNWEFSGRFRQELKEGKKSLGGAIGPNFGAARAVILPEPVDYETNEVEVKASYARWGLQAEFGYFGSFFTDHNRSLTWQNPFAEPGSPERLGRLALPPDNQFNQISGSLGYDLGRDTRITANLALGRMTQDESFLPFTINPDLQRPLPRSSPDAEVNTRLVNLKILSRPTERLRLLGEYKFDERDNDTPQAEYDYVVADSAGSLVSRINLPYGYRRNLFRAEGGYELPRRTDLSVGVAHDRFDRSYQEADRTDENSVWVKLKSSPHERIDLRLGYEYKDRDNDSYSPVPETTPPQNPLMRKFYMADRKRNKATAALTARFNDAWSLGLSADYSDDDYTHSQLGLTEGKDYSATLDASYNPRRGVTVHAFYTRQKIESEQAGSQTFSTPDWSAKTDDSFNTLGAGVKWTLLADRLDLGLDYVYADSKGSIDVTSDLVPTEPLPDFKTRRHTLSLNATYRLKEDLDLRVGYLYERYRSDDWTLDGVDPDTIPNVLSLGEQSPNYSVSLYSAAVRMRF
jgi:MtrB/PioB family decaheme-associated outer membrane protein